MVATLAPQQKSSELIRNSKIFCVGYEPSHEEEGRV
jgi:hypothetical protein